MPFMAFFVSGGIVLLSRPVFMKSGGSYLLHVWFSRPFHKRMSSCFQSSAYASCRYRMDGCINDFITTINFFCDAYLFVAPGNAIFPGAMPGYVPPYWDGAPLPHAPPFRNLYSNHGMTAFDTMLIPRAPFSVPPFMPSMYRSIPGFG